MLRASLGRLMGFGGSLGCEALVNTVNIEGVVYSFAICCSRRNSSI